MDAPSSCPPPDRLRQVLDDSLPPEELTRLLAHLNTCADCQRALDLLAGATEELLGAARGVGRRPRPEEDSLRALLQHLKQDSRATALYFSPADSPVPPTEVLGPLDDYQITGLIGQGAMGMVLEAIDPALGRKVAIKVLSLSLAGDARARERFAREARAAAAVPHEHVVRIYAVREARGLPYIVMEYLAGGSLQDYLDQHGPLDWRVAARLGAEVAEGLAAAHARGLVHRDIKPSNILLESVAPGAPGAAKIADFGLARAADESRLTQTGILAGTPMFMAPEQARGEAVDGRADLFSLASVLYALTTGREPFRAPNPMAMLREVCETTPPPIRAVKPEVPAWLSDLVERLHAKRPADRDLTAAQVAEFLRYNLAHPDEPTALPPQRRQANPRLRRSRALLVTLALLLASLGVIGSWSGLSSGRWFSLGVRGSSILPRATLQGHDGPVWSIAFSPDGQALATGSDDTSLRLWDASTAREIAAIPRNSAAVLSVAFAPHGQVVAGLGDGSLHVWDVATRKESRAFAHTGGNGRRMALSPDGKWLAVGTGSQGVEIWDFERRTLLHTLPGHQTSLTALAFAPGGRQLATGDAGGNIRLWDVETGGEVAAFQADPLGLRSLSYSPVGGTLASTGAHEHEVKLWDVAKHETVATLPGPTADVLSLAFSPDGALLAAGTRDGAVVVWDVAGGRPATTFQAHRGNVWAVAFSPDGRTLATAGQDRLGKLWDVERLRGS